MQKKKAVMWKVLALSAAVFTGGGVLAAQAAEKFVVRTYVAQMLGQAQKGWNLTGEQREKVRTILHDAVPRGIAIHDNMKLAPDDKREKLETLKNATKTRIEKVLTPAQREKAAHWRETAEVKVKATLERIADQLNLSPDQRAKIKPIVAHSFEQAKALRGDMSLTVAQKFVRLHEIHRAARARVDEVLTPQQRKQLNAVTTQVRAEARQQFELFRQRNPQN